MTDKIQNEEARESLIGMLCGDLYEKLRYSHNYKIVEAAITRHKDDIYKTIDAHVAEHFSGSYLEAYRKSYLCLDAKTYTTASRDTNPKNPAENFTVSVNNDGGTIIRLHFHQLRLYVHEGHKKAAEAAMGVFEIIDFAFDTPAGSTATALGASSHPTPRN